MIFSGTSPDGRKHIDLIFNGEKTQTRRPTQRYEGGKTYAVQAKRTAKADPRGRIYIMGKWWEHRASAPLPSAHATAEGFYTSEEYEALYEQMYPKWTERWAYIFKVVK